MRPFLAIETSTSRGSVALGDGMLSETALGPGVRQAATLLPAVRALLRDAGIGTKELGGVVVGGGPGSFTGVRIAAATARGLVRALDLPLYAYSSLAAAAIGAGLPGRAVCALFDARRGEVYAACYRFAETGPWETILAPTVDALERVVDRLKSVEPVYVGAGVTRYRDRLPATSRADVVPTASALLRLRERDPNAGRVANPGSWEPAYMRPPAAKQAGP